MSNSNASSSASSPCRIELRGSAWLARTVVVLALLGAAGLALTDAGAPTAMLVGGASLLEAARAARRERRMPQRSLVLLASGDVLLDGRRVEDFSTEGQGPLTRLAWQVNGRRERVVAWPDVVGRAQRRELRLWAAGVQRGAGAPPVAP